MTGKTQRPVTTLLEGADRAGATEGFGDAFGPPNSKLQSDEQYVPRDLKGVPVWVWNRDGPSRAIAEALAWRVRPR